LAAPGPPRSGKVRVSTFSPPFRPRPAIAASFVWLRFSSARSFAICTQFTPFLGAEAECGISARLARFYLGFRIGVTGSPVFWRKGHVPKNRIGQHELHAHLRMTALMPVNVRDNTL
jgi:hypothetical protein